VGFFSMPSGAWLIRRFGPKVFVSITDTSVEFRRGDRIRSLQPFLYVRDERIVAIGSAPAEACDCLAVFVSDRDERHDRFAHLAAHGLHAIIARAITIKPTVRVSLCTTLISPEDVRAAFLGSGAGEIYVQPG